MQAGGRIMKVIRASSLRFAFLLPFLAGCDERGHVEFRRAEPVLIPADRPEWTGAAPDEKVVARVNGIPIPAGRYERALAEGVAPAEVLRALIAEEALAQEAAHGQKSQAADLSRVFERALAARWLTRHLAEGVRPEDMSEADLAPLWRLPAVRGRFDHLTIFVVQDYQWICCDGTPAMCDTPQAIACFAEGEVALLATQEALRRLDPESEDIPLLLDDLKVSASRLAYQEYEFAWDELKRLQKGRTIFDDAVVNAVVSTPAGRFAASPVRSKFGWHLPFVKEIHPEVHKDLSDPEVRREIATTFITYLRQRRFLEVLADLIPAEGLFFHSKQFEGFRRSRPPRLEVTLFPEALEAWDHDRTDIEGR